MAGFVRNMGRRPRDYRTTGPRDYGTTGLLDHEWSDGMMVADWGVSVIANAMIGRPKCSVVVRVREVREPETN